MEQGQFNADTPADFVQKFKVIDGVRLPCHPRDEHLWSRWPVGAIGCFGCGSKHNFSECATSRTKKGKDAFHFDLHCHKPNIWFKWINRQNDSRGNKEPAKEGTGRGRGRDAVIPAWMNNASSNRYGPSQRSKNNNSDAHGYDVVDGSSVDQYVNVVHSYVSKDSALRRMPISSNNKLPHIAFPIGKSKGAASITALYDTGGALNTGNIHLHNVIRKKTAAAVARYEEFNGTNPFDPIKLCGAILDPSDYNAEKHGIYLLSSPTIHLSKL